MSPTRLLYFSSTPTYTSTLLGGQHAQLRRRAQTPAMTGMLVSSSRRRGCCSMLLNFLDRRLRFRKLPGGNATVIQFVNLRISAPFGLGIEEIGRDPVDDRQAAKEETDLLTPAGVLGREEEGSAITLGDEMRTKSVKNNSQTRGQQRNSLRRRRPPFWLASEVKKLRRGRATLYAVSYGYTRLAR